MISPADYGAMRAFAAVADALSFARAADILGVSSSALSQTIRGLEDRVGARLLNRTTRSVSLTEAGAELRQRLTPALEALEDAFGRVRRTGREPAGTVRVHAFRLAGETLLMPMLARFRRQHPQIVLDVTLDDRVADFVKDGFDAAIRLGELIEQDMIAMRLGRDIRQVAVASPAYLAECGTPLAPDDLLTHRCIGWRWPGHATPYAWEFCRDGRWFSVAVAGPLVVSNRAFAVRAACEGVGIAFAADLEVAPFLADGRLVALLEDWSAPFAGFFLCTPRQRHMRPVLRAFVDAMRDARSEDSAA